MPDYEAMYKRLFNEYTRLIALIEPLGSALVDLKLAQQETEEICISSTEKRICYGNYPRIGLIGEFTGSIHY